MTKKLLEAVVYDLMNEFTRIFVIIQPEKLQIATGIKNGSKMLVKDAGQRCSRKFFEKVLTEIKNSDIILENKAKPLLPPCRIRA